MVERLVMELFQCFKKYNPVDGYQWLNSRSVIGAKLNRLWRVVSKHSTWLFRFHFVWQKFIEPKKALFA